MMELKPPKVTQAPSPAQYSHQGNPPQAFPQHAQQHGQHHQRPAKEFKKKEIVPPPQQAQAPPSQQPRQLNVKDALSYLELVKFQFSSQPEVYHRFLEIMKDFKNQV